MHRITIVALVLIMALASCGGGGSSDPDPTGTITGILTIGGPIDGAVDLNIGLFATGSDTPIVTSNIGHVSSATHGTSAGRTNSFSFTDLALGTYLVRAYGETTSNEMVFYYTSDPVTLTTAAPSITGLTPVMSFTGAEPWGTISGVIDLAGDWPADRTVYIGFTQASSDEMYQYYFTENQASDGYVEHNTDGQVIFNIDHLAYDAYTVGLYGYNSTTHAFDTYGMRDVEITVHGGDPNITNVNFPADFAGDPGADPVLGTISGVVTFSDDLPDTGGFVAIGANTIPPQAGAPIASYDVEPADLDGNMQVAYTLEDLPNGEYTIGIFSYDFATHTAVYFGAYDGTVTISDQTKDVADIDFDADISLL